MGTAIFRITAVLWACMVTSKSGVFTTGMPVQGKHQHEPTHTITESATEFSLLDDAGDHVLNFGAARHGRRLDSTSKIHLKFNAFGTSFIYELHRSPSVFAADTKIYAYDKTYESFHKFDAPEEARSFSSEVFDAALTFLSHKKITGTLLLQNR